MRWATSIAAGLRMDEEAWARHANPWSVWTRVPILPLMTLAVWSRGAIGWWALLPVAALVMWAWLNPRAFPPPTSTDNWASKGVLGERVWLNQAAVPIPDHHRTAAKVLTAVASAGMLPLVWGLATLALWPTVAGLAIVVLGKLWFVDRMVWLYEDMADKRPEYRAWLR